MEEDRRLAGVQESRMNEIEKEMEKTCSEYKYDRIDIKKIDQPQKTD